MLKEKEHIDKLFADYLYDYEEKVPSYVWNNIQDELKHKKKLRKFSAYRAIAATVALLLTFGLGYFSSDYALRKKYEAKYFNSKSSELIVSREQSEQGIDKDDSAVIVENETSKSEIKRLTNELNEIQPENKGILYKLFDLSKEIFFKDSKNELNTNQLAQGNRNSEESVSNQLLIDTLLLEKENPHKGGFLLNSKKQSESKWSFGTKFSPVYSMAENTSSSQQIEATHSLKSAINNEKPNTKAEEKSLMAFSGGVNVNYHLSKRWSLESGIFYSQRKHMAENLIGSAMTGYEDEMVVYTPEGMKYLQPDFSSLENGTPEVIGSSRDETYYSLNMNYVSNFEYIELPLLIRYKIIDRKIGLDILSGVSTNFLIANKSSIVQDDNDLWTGQSDNLNPMLYNATLGFGLNYNFYNNLSFNLEPTFKYSITSESSSFKYPYSFAIFAGFSYRFK